MIWPANDEINAPTTFENACVAAISSGESLLLASGTTAVLTTEVRLRGDQHLTIAGEAPGCSIKGNTWCLFVVGKRSKLEITGIEIQHFQVNDNHRELGAAIQATNRGVVFLDSCTVTSVSGFGIWTVLSAQVVLKSCEVVTPARSACVCFGNSHLSMMDTLVVGAGVHAVCARGAVQVKLERCRIEHSVYRGIYAYANAKVELNGCVVTGTVRSDHAAIEAHALQLGEAAAIVVRNSIVEGNAGVGLRLHGNVDTVLEGNTVRDNGGGGFDIEFHTETAIARRPKISAARIGDWRCNACQNIEAEVLFCKQLTCPRCGGAKEDGTALSEREVILLNRIDLGVCGVWEYDAGQVWKRFDTASDKALEDAYQRQRINVDEPAEVVLLGDGKWAVDLGKMQQLNIKTQMMRLVRRVAPQSP